MLTADAARTARNLGLLVARTDCPAVLGTIVHLYPDARVAFVAWDGQPSSSENSQAYVSTASLDIARPYPC
jgi:hypothetical protein